MDKQISFILCSRHDNYMGNAVGRLELVLNYLAQNVEQLGHASQVEIMVADWGSETPLRKVLKLGSTAAQITRFLEVPPVTVGEVQADSPFAEVLALNAAARRSTGQYIGRIDQDTLVGRRFLRYFFAAMEGRGAEGIDLGGRFVFSRRREIPFGFASKNPSLAEVTEFIRRNHGLLRVEMHDHLVRSSVGIMMLSRKIWEECGGYDERLIYWGWMEADLSYRLEKMYPVLDVGTVLGHDFYHLEHYDPSQPRVTARRRNPEKIEGLALHPNASDWGLMQYPLAVQACEPCEKVVAEGQCSYRSWLVNRASLAAFFRYVWRAAATATARPSRQNNG